MRIFLICVILLNNFCSSFAQNWEAVASFDRRPKIAFKDVENNELYLCGSFKYINGDTNNHVTKWDGNTFTPLGCGLIQDCENPPGSNTVQLVNDVIVYHDTVYATGSFLTVDNQVVNSLVKFNGASWEPVGEGLKSSSGQRGVGHRLKIINDELYICGQFSFCNGVPANSVAKYNGFEWSSVFDAPQIYTGARPIKDIAYFNGNWFIGGNFYDFNDFSGPKWNILQYNGSEWTDVGGGIRGSLSLVEGFEVYNNKLVVYGVMAKSSGSPGNGIASWDGENWDDMGGGIRDYWSIDNIHVFEAKSINGRLYVGSKNVIAGNIIAESIAFWDGTNWCSLSDQLNSFSGMVSSIEEFNDNIYISGIFSHTVGDSSVNNIAKWIGGDFVGPCGNATSVTETEEEGFKLFPNPTFDYLNIINPTILGNFHIYLLDATGRLIQNEQFSGIGSHTLNLTGLAKGVYYCRIVQGNEVIVTEKVVKVE